MHRSKPTARRPGFTLIELLIVIVIIMILVAISVPVVMKILKDAKIAQAKADVISIQNAINAYYHEFGMLPIPDKYHGTKRPTYDGEDWYFPRGDVNSNVVYKEELQLIYAKLQGENPKNKSFLAMSSGDEGYVTDPWGTPLRIYVDAMYDGGTYCWKQSWWGSMGPKGVCVIRSAGPNRTFDAEMIAGSDMDALPSIDDVMTIDTGSK